MLPSRWKSFSRSAADRRYLALLSYLPLQKYQEIPTFIRFSRETQRQLETAEGLIGYSLQAQILARRFWTLSVWEDETTLMRFVHHEPHSEIMNALAPHMGRTAFVRWTVSSAELPLNWREAKKRYCDQTES
jgi:heme-degrading monooxygenase HmoA